MAARGFRPVSPHVLDLGVLAGNLARGPLRPGGPAPRGCRPTGRALISHLARLTLARGYTRLQWSVLDGNTPALDFYTKLGAARLDELKVHRLDRAALEDVAARAESIG